MKQRVRVVAIIRRGEQILLLKRNSGRAVGATYWELPTGKIEVGEQPDEAMARNLELFLGKKTKSIKLIDAVTFVGLEEASRLLNLYLVYEVSLEEEGEMEAMGKYTAYKFTRDFAGMKLSEATGTVVQIEGICGEETLEQSGESESFAKATESIRENKNVNKAWRGAFEKRRFSQGGKAKSQAREVANATILMVDGASRGNPGAAGIGYVFFGADGKVIERGGEFIGFATSRVAEYTALKKGLERARELGISELKVISDNLMVINQMKGIFKVKNQDIMPINREVKEILRDFEAVSFQHEPRNLTAAADKEANLAIDRVMKN